MLAFGGRDGRTRTGLRHALVLLAVAARVPQGPRAHHVEGWIDEGSLHEVRRVDMLDAMRGALRRAR